MITVTEVTTKKDLKRYVHFPNELYKGNKYYVPQIESMDRDTLTPGKNAAFEVCEGKYWLATDESGKIVGRVAAFINHRYNEATGEKTCRFGWMDYIDSQEVVNLLVAKVEEYAREKGMTNLVGPMGFLEFDAAGVLVEGYDKLPTAYGKYNYPYYEPRMIDAGFTKDRDFVEYIITCPEENERLIRFARLLEEKNNVHLVNCKSKKELLAKYADGIFSVMNEAYSHIHGFSKLSDGQCNDLKNQFLPNLVLDYVSVAVDADDNVVGFAILMPSLAKAMQKANGSMFPFGWYHIVKALRHNDTLDALLIAVRDDYRSKGINAILMEKIFHSMKKNHAKYVESTRELDENHHVQNMWGHYEHTLIKRARLFTKTLE